MFDRGWKLSFPGITFEWGGNDPADTFKLNRGRAINMAPPAAADTELETQDNPDPYGDGVRPGVDYRRGRTWTFTIGIKQTTEAAARAFLAEVERAWRGDGVRLAAGHLAALTYQLPGGAHRTAYGRPRKFTPNYDDLHAGRASALVTFDTRDDVWYGDEQSVRIDIAPASTGGFAMPFDFPLVMASTTEQAGELTVDGNLGAVVAAEIHGPIVNPTVRLTSGWSVRLSTTLLTGQVVTLDARPWARTILRSDGASYAGLRARGNALADMALPDGPSEISLQGTDPTGTAYLMLRWQTSHAGLA